MHVSTGAYWIPIQIGNNINPWTHSAIRTELLDGECKLSSEVERLVQHGGRYALICTDHDLTRAQRDDSRKWIAVLLAEQCFEEYGDLIEVFGASQLTEFAERYPETASLVTVGPIQEAGVLEERRHDAHVANFFEESPKQAQLIARIRTGLQGETKHIRVLGKSGLGKTRIALESLKDEDIAPRREIRRIP